MPAPRVLLINKFYHDVGPAGGVGRYLVQEQEDLEKAGWEVIPFAMADEHARPSPYARYFVKARDYSSPRWGGGALGDAVNLVWNREAAAKLDALIRATRPQVAHLHNIYHHLSPSLLPVLAMHGIPTVMTLHDLRLLCPAIHMLRQDQVCERCRGGQLHNAVLGRCVKESRAASLLAAAETLYQRSRRLYETQVQTFLCPSEFYTRKYAEWGFPAHKLRHLRNFVDLDFWHPDRLPQGQEKDAYIYFGRVSREKGLRTVLDAQALWEQAHARGQCEAPLQLLVAGSGPCIENFKARVAQLHLKTVTLLGPLPTDQLRQALGRARFSVIPSRCYENCPMAGLESLASGIPLVATTMGGAPELVQPGRTGLVAPAGQAQEWFAALRRAAAEAPGWRRNARAWAEQNASRTIQMDALRGVLEKAAGI